MARAITYVTSRTIIRPSMEQLRVGFEPFHHGLKRGFAAQRALRQLMIVKAT